MIIIEEATKKFYNDEISLEQYMKYINESDEGDKERCRIEKDMNKIFEKINRKLTKNHTEVPLFWVDFNLNKYNESGAKNSCTVKIHPDLAHDVFIQCQLNDTIDYIREHWDMEKLSK